MILPIRTTSDDIEKVCTFLVRKPVGVSLSEAKPVLDKKYLDGRKLAALKGWGLLEDNERLRLTDLGRKIVGSSTEERNSAYLSIIQRTPPYGAIIEKAAHSEIASMTTHEVAAHWHDHFADEASSSEKTINDQAVCFFHIAQGAGLGTLTIGRRGSPTRIDFAPEGLSAFLDGAPAPLPPAAEDQEPEVAQEEESETEGMGDGQEEKVAVSPVSRETPDPNKPIRVFITHGKNMELVDQVQTMLEMGDLESELAVAEETPAIPVPEKVFDAMRRCDAAVIIVSGEPNGDGDGEQPVINQNVLIEIGAAFVLYNKRVVLLWDSRLSVPSNLQGLYRCEFTGTELSWTAGMKFMKAINSFKKREG